MKINLKEYLEERDKKREIKNRPGPVLTLHRQYGCLANPIAIKIISRIAQMHDESVTQTSWRYINKEAINEVAKELHWTSERLDKKLTDAPNAVTEIFGSMTHHYIISDKKIINLIKDVMESYILKGDLIIIGRAGAHFCRAVEDKLNVRLVAPLDWRIQSIMKSKNMKREEASRLVQEMDDIRTTWWEKITGKPYNDDLFDLILNRATLSDEDIVETILVMMKRRRLI
jgi:cytidylate kinase